MEMSRGIGGMMLAVKRQSTWRKTSPIAALSKTNFSLIYMDLNPRFRGARTFNFPLIAASFFSCGGPKMGNLKKKMQIHSILYQYELHRSSSTEVGFVCDS